MVCNVPCTRISYRLFHTRYSCSPSKDACFACCQLQRPPFNPPEEAHTPVAKMEKNYEGIGRCKCAFWFAVIHDILGFLILLSGVFWDVFFHDFLLYAGAVIVFLSLIWWVFWYSGNIEVPPEELEDDVVFYKKSRGISGVVRKVSNTLTNGIRNSFRRSGRAGHGGSPRTGNGTDDAPQVPGGISMISYGQSRPETPKFHREPLVV
ncbi:hypothetical protein ACEWY4_025862 [Coilia grayii]|uniref:Uncharacterized protein n=1 Tax=Coilia grayii TaxID=363190 RepID=A0ABD1ITN8_9TELE